MYIEEHIQNVRTVFDAMKRMDIIPTEIRDQLEKNVAVHDASKYSPEEFDAYRRQWFPVSPQEKAAAKRDFLKAWDHHKEHNLHHWESPKWTNPHTKVAIPMDPVYVYEMVCDWQAMSLKFGGNCLQWFNQQKRITLHPATRDLAISIMEKVIVAFPN